MLNHIELFVEIGIIHTSALAAVRNTNQGEI